MKTLLLFLLLPLFGMGQFNEQYRCGTWEKQEPEYTDWKTVDTVGNKPINTPKRNWVESGWEDISPQWMTLEYTPCGKNVPDKYRMYRVCSITGIRQSKDKTINYKYIPRPMSEYEKVVDSLTPPLNTDSIQIYHNTGAYIAPGYGVDIKDGWISIDTAQLLQFDTTGFHMGNPSAVWQSFGDTIPALLWVQYTRRNVPMLRDCYLINGIPHYRSKGKFRKLNYYRWAVSKENWNTKK